MSQSKGRKYSYEGLFLVSQQSATDLNSVVSHLKEILNKAEARVIALSKWDERRLAFEIEKQKRGVYFLAYFECDPVNVITIERDCNLSETVMRSMVTRADHLSDDEMMATDGQEQLATESSLREDPAEPVSGPAEAASEAPA